MSERSKEALTLSKWRDRTVILHVISLGRSRGPVCRELEKAVCVAACRRAVNMGCWLLLERGWCLNGVCGGGAKHHPGAACGVSLVLEASLEQTALISPYCSLNTASIGNTVWRCGS